MLEFIIKNCVSILSLLITIITLYRMYKLKNILSINLSLIVDNSHSVTKNIEDSCDNPCLVESIQNLNHQITHLLVIVPTLAKQWVYINKPKSEWPLWEQKLQISMKKYRSKNHK